MLNKRIQSRLTIRFTEKIRQNHNRQINWSFGAIEGEKTLMRSEFD